MINLSQAKKLIDLARQSILDYFEDKETNASEQIKEEFSEKKGLFVSLYSEEELAGCIGYTMPITPLYKAVIDLARAAAFEDTRFPPLRKEQMKGLRIEISVLTVPERLIAKKPEDYLKQIEIGKDGLIIKDPFGGSGLLLPQVAVDFKWGKEEFLANTCIKADLDSECWKDLRHHVYKFQAQVFTEKDGKIVEKLISK